LLGNFERIKQESYTTPGKEMSHGIESNWTSEDRFHLANLTVPVPINEQKRVEILRKSKLLDVSTNDTGFSRFTSLASRLFSMQYSAVSFVEVERVVFKAKLGLDFIDIDRNDWFDAYTVLPDSSEVYVVPDCLTDHRFKDKSYVKEHPKIRFYAGAAIMVDNFKIGVLSIMDTEPHKFFSLEDKENLLDLGAAAAQLAKEKLQTALNLSAERANIVVSMMHHLRTPMTSLNFATSLLCNDVHNIRSDYASASGSDVVHNNQHSASNILAAPSSAMDEDHTQKETKGTPAAPFQPPQSVFQSFESSFAEISNALNQLNILVDSSLSLGQAIIKCSTNEVVSSSSANLQAMDPRSRFTECNIIEYLGDMFQNNLPVHNHHLEIEWIVDTKDMVRGTHVTFPDAVMLIVISTVAHMSTESNSLGFHFSFEQVEEDDMEYPELITKMLEGRLSIKVFAKDSRAYPNRILDTGNAMDVDPQSQYPYLLPRSQNNANNTRVDTHAQQPVRSQIQQDASGSVYNSHHHAPDVLSKQNFLSIDKILCAINGSSREYIDDILLLSTIRPGASLDLQQIPENTNPVRINDPRTPEFRMIHEFLVPCKILLAPSTSSSSSTQAPLPQHHLRFFRPSTKHTVTHPDAVMATETTVAAIAGAAVSIPGAQLGAAVGTAASIMGQSSNTNSSGMLVPPPIQTDSWLSTGHQQPQHQRNSPQAALNATTTVSRSDDKVALALSSSQQHQMQTTTVPSSEARQLRVLVVEDTIPVQKLLTRWLQNQGCHVACASNGKIGLDQLTSQIFDIAFVDFLMVSHTTKLPPIVCGSFVAYFK
jgi:hypothetical protein